MKRLAICGELYSANVGDRAIHDSLHYLLKRLDPGIEIIPIDLSGRISSSGPTERVGLNQRVALLAALPIFYPALMMLNIASQQVKRLRGQRSRWRQRLETAELLVVGGGQLLMDDALNFPLKISSLAHVAQSLNLPFSFSACGVGSTHTWLGRRLLCDALVGAQSISLRDHLSQNRLKMLCPGLASQVTMDPAIWAGDVYPFPPAGGNSGCIGLGVINRNEANLHLPREQRFSKHAWEQLWIELIGELAANNRQVELFTTGSPVDDLFAQALFAHAQGRGWAQVSLAMRPANPQQLLTSLRDYSVVVATRLHAAILANAIGISTIGLSWDTKVQTYYSESGRADLCFDLNQLSIQQVIHAAMEMKGQPFPDRKLEEMKQRALVNAHLILGR